MKAARFKSLGPFTDKEIQAIAEEVRPSLDLFAERYSLRKYPLKPYARLKRTFAARRVSKAGIEDALRWKWGHFGKARIPEVHRNLIHEVASLWPSFARGRWRTPVSTFEWWSGSFARRTTYVTAAFITHLVHHDAIPIIDQHNYRAMNILVASVRGGKVSKARPSTWSDIEDLRQFMSALSVAVGCSLDKLDRFLMMYGKSRKRHCDR